MADIFEFPGRKVQENFTLEDHWPVLQKELQSQFAKVGLESNEATQNAAMLASECRGYVAALMARGEPVGLALKAITPYALSRMRDILGLPPPSPS